MSMASSNPKRYYHVFLSFRGPDVRKNFLSHLSKALDQKGFNTFVDDEELRKGEEIWPSLERAIQESCVAVIIFSENYASSRWCLEELSEIMECKKRNDLIVFPVFYKVEPREVKSGRKSYEDAMAKHESDFGKDSEKVQRWKKALLDARNLSGCHFSDRDERGEAEFIQSIVRELLSHLRPRSLYVAKHPVDIKSRVRKLISLSERAGNDVLMIGLWGTGGIGKTTIAKALYNAIETQFEGCSYLADVKDKWNQSNDRVALQKQLLSEILSLKDITVYTVDGGISLIQERLCRKKVLLLLDDVDHINQLYTLAGNGNWFGKGSRIVVTTRNKQLLTSHGINCVYDEMQILGHCEARDLFCQHAFPDGKSDEIGQRFINRAVNYCGGLPLALEVLGSFFRSYRNNEDEWESELQKLHKFLNTDINQVLKASFDKLEPNEREIFLDIACFFKGKNIDYIKEVLDSCGLFTAAGIKILIDRSLIKNESGTLQMHDLIQLMGKNIVMQEWPDNLGKCSRLWFFNDVENLLYEDKGENTVKAIVLNLPTPEEMIISPGAFANMKRLRMLILLNVHISSQGPVRLPNELAWLEWPNPPDLEFGPGQKKLVKLHFRNSHIKQLVGNYKKFICLKSIEIVDCNSLVNVPDISSVPLLESVYLLRCESLVEVHQSVGDHDQLKLLTISSCSNLWNFPKTLRTKSLQKLDLSNCYKLGKCPDILEKMEHLEHFNLGGTGIEEIPAPIEKLVSVRTIALGYYEYLKMLPSGIHKLKNLPSLILYNCSNLAMFPRNLEDSIDPDGDLGFPSLSSLNLHDCHLLEAKLLEDGSNCPTLTRLNLSNNKFTHLPTCINNYNYFKDLFVYHCKRSKGVRGADVSSPKVVEIVASGKEMPAWILPCGEDSISFMVPPKLMDKALGLALCVTFGQDKENPFGNLFSFVIFIDGVRAFDRLMCAFPSTSDLVSLVYIPSNRMRGEKKLMHNDWIHFQVYFRVVIARKKKQKKLGFRLICEPEEDWTVAIPTRSADGNKLEFQGKILKERQFRDTEEEDSPVEKNSNKEDG